MRSARTNLWRTAFASLTTIVFASGCTRSNNHAGATAVGDVSLAFNLDGGGELRDVAYKITGPTIEAMTRHLDVTKMSHVTDTVTGLPAGTGYAITADATSVDGKRSCHAQSGFEIGANQMAMVSLTLLCRSVDGGVGAVSVSGTFDGCPVITAHWLSAKSAPLGNGFSAGVTAGDPDIADDSKKNPLTYDWKMVPDSLGMFTGAEGKPTQRFACTQAGKGILSVTVGDGACNRTASADVECLMYPAAAAKSGTCVAITSYSVGARYGKLPVGEALPVFTTASSQASRGLSFTWTATPASGGSFADGHAASTTFTCSAPGDVTLALRASDGVCADDIRDPVVKVTCLPIPRGRPDAGTRDGMSDAGSPGGMTDAGTFEGGAGGGSCPSSEPASSSMACDECTGPNLESTDGCCTISDAADRALCGSAAQCFMAHASTCVGGGDVTNCFCGTSAGKCFAMDGAANGPCAAEVLAAAKTNLAAVVQMRFTSGDWPVGRAVNLIAKRGSFCAAECGVP